jgi:hypothetical protein
MPAARSVVTMARTACLSRSGSRLPLELDSQLAGFWQGKQPDDPLLHVLLPDLLPACAVPLPEQVKDNGTSLFPRQGRQLAAPEGVPEHDYVPLIALLGSQFTDYEVTLVAGELAFSCNPESAQEIKKTVTAITRTTVTDSDTALVRSHLAAGGWPPAAPDRD